MFELEHPTLNYPWETVFSSSATDVMTLNTLIMDNVKAGKRPKIEESCLPDLSNLICTCWRQVPDERPSAEGLIDTFTNFISANSQVKTVVYFGLSFITICSVI